MGYPAKTKKDLKNEYKISYPILRQWLLKIPGLEVGSKRKIFSPLEVEKIYTHIGAP